MVMPTNTLILTGLTTQELEDEQIIKTLQQQVIANTPETSTVKFTILKSFRRIIIMFEEVDYSEKLHKILKEAGFQVGFSMHDNYDEFVLTDEGYKFDTSEYLRLPSNGNSFIISPPPSPPPGWKSFQEEPPESRSIYSQKDLAELVFKRVGNTDEIEKIFKSDGEKNKRHVLHENRDSPIIVLDAPENEELQLDKQFKETPQKVSMPPMNPFEF